MVVFCEIYLRVRGIFPIREAPFQGRAMRRVGSTAGCGRWWWVVAGVGLGFLLWMAPAGAQTPCQSEVVAPASQPALRSECEALWAFLSRLDDPGTLDDTDNPSAWHPSVPLAQWEGVVVTDGSVSELVLPSSGLEGTLAPDLGKLRNLRNLDLGGNLLRGSIPSELGGLAMLESLFLYNNRFSGPVPEEMGLLTGLKILELGGNELSGPIPPELGLLTDLEGLFLHGNRLSGAIPEELGALAKLERLYLQGNRLVGAIPPELGRLSELVVLDLSMNYLSGPVPSGLRSLAKLETLRLHGNRLSVSGSAGPFSPGPLVPEPPAVSAEPQQPASGRFIDDDGSVHEESIELLAALGVTAGCNPPENDRFCPDDVVTRAQMMAFLSRLLGGVAAVEGARVRISDVAEDAWYFNDVRRMIQSGVVELPEDGVFRPLDPLTRLDLAVFLVRAFPALPEVMQPVGVFEDIPADSSGAAAVEGMYEAGVTTGCSTAEPLTYCPHRPVTRDQMASFLVRALGVRPETSGPVTLPGAGVQVRMARAVWPSGHFQAALYRLLLQELGYEVGDPAETELEPDDAYSGMAEGRVDFWANSWYPDHQSFMDISLEDGSKVGDHVSAVGDQMAAGGMRGFLISRAFAEEHGIETIDDLDRNPAAVAVYDSTDANPQNGIVDIHGCPPGWACYDIIDSMVAFSGWESIDQVTGTYESMHAEALAKLGRGEPILVYAWTPGKYVSSIRPGVDAVWVGVDRVLDDSNPRNRPGGEIWDQRPGEVAVRPSMCPGVSKQGVCRTGWRVSDIRVTASDEFLKGNPAARRLFELVRLDPLDVSHRIAMQSRGAGPTELASRWIHEHRRLVDIWLVQSRIAASDRAASVT